MSYETNDKMVSHPDHYKSGKYEVIDIIDEFTKDLSGTEAVCTANAIKYILRWKKKNGIQDVKKAIWYLQHLVDKEEERLQEEHSEFDEERLNKRKEFVDDALNHIRKNSVYGIPKEHAEFDEERLEKITEIVPTVCKTCKHENDTCRDECTYLNPVDWEPKEEPTCSDCTFYEKGHCKFLNMLTMSDHDACGYLDPKTKEKEVDMDKIMNRPTFIDVKEEEIHSCDDCAFKVDDPNIPPCLDCDLHSNPPSKWVAES